MFTARIAHCWPLAELSVFGEGATVAFDGGQIIERGSDGTNLAVGRRHPVGAAGRPGVQPASRAAGRAGQPGAGHLRRRGRPDAGHLEHGGREAFDDPAAARAEYDQGWPMVLDRFGEYAGHSTWVALLHRPGPAARTACWSRTGDAAAEGMTVLRRTVRGAELLGQGGRLTGQRPGVIAQRQYRPPGRGQAVPAVQARRP